MIHQRNNLNCLRLQIWMIISEVFDRYYNFISHPIPPLSLLIGLLFYQKFWRCRNSLPPIFPQHVGNAVLLLKGKAYKSSTDYCMCPLLIDCQFLVEFIDISCGSCCC